MSQLSLRVALLDPQTGFLTESKLNSFRAPALPFLLPTPAEPAIPHCPVRLTLTKAIVDFELLQKHIDASESRHPGGSIRCPLTNRVIYSGENARIRFRKMKRQIRKLSKFAEALLCWFHDWYDQPDEDFEDESIKDFRIADSRIREVICAAVVDPDRSPSLAEEWEDLSEKAGTRLDQFQRKREISKKILDSDQSKIAFSEASALVQMAIKEVTSWNCVVRDVSFVFRLWIRLGQLAEDPVETASCCVGAARHILLSLENHQDEFAPRLVKRLQRKFRMSLKKARSTDPWNVDSWRVECEDILRRLKVVDSSHNKTTKMALDFAKKVWDEEILRAEGTEGEDFEEELEPLFLEGLELEFMYALHRIPEAKDDSRFLGWLNQRLEHYTRHSNERMIVRLTQTDDQGDGRGDVEPEQIDTLTRRLLGDLREQKNRATKRRKWAEKLMENLMESEKSFQIGLRRHDKAIRRAERRLAQLDGRTVLDDSKRREPESRTTRENFPPALEGRIHVALGENEETGFTRYEAPTRQ